MQIIVDKETNVVAFDFEDKQALEIKKNKIKVKGKNRIISCYNEDNCTLVKDVTLPADYFPGRYLYVNKEFVPNPDYVHFEPPEAPEPLTPKQIRAEKKAKRMEKLEGKIIDGTATMQDVEAYNALRN